jgi:hypothetical protein
MNILRSPKIFIYHKDKGAKVRKHEGLIQSKVFFYVHFHVNFWIVSGFAFAMMCSTHCVIASRLRRNNPEKFLSVCVESEDFMLSLRLDFKTKKYVAVKSKILNIKIILNL